MKKQMPVFSPHGGSRDLHSSQRAEFLSVGKNTELGPVVFDIRTPEVSNVPAALAVAYASFHSANILTILGSVEFRGLTSTQPLFLYSIDRLAISARRLHMGVS